MNDSAHDAESLVKENAELRRRISELEVRAAPPTATQGEIAGNEQSTKRQRFSEDDYRRLLSMAIPLPLCVFPRDGSSMDFNQCFVETFGYTTEDVSTLADWQRRAYPDPEYRRQAAREVAAILDGVGAELTAIGPLERRVTCKDGRVLTGIIKGASYGDIIALAFVDLTSLMRAEAATREADARYRVLVERSIEGIGITQDDRIIYANRALLEIFGYKSLDELRGSSLLDLLAPGSRRAVEERIERRRRGERVPPRYESQIVRKDGSIRDLEIGTAEIQLNAQTHAQSTFRDITERKRTEAEKAKLEEQLHQARKMEAIGTLAGGVAHDFNNILCGLLNGLSLLELELGDAAEPHRTDIHNMKDLVQRGADLAKQLLGFARGGKYNVQPLDLVEAVRRTAAMFGCTRRDITIQHEFARDLTPVLMDLAQLEQVLLNLFLNAAQAMPDGGRLTVRAENVTLSEEACSPHGAKAGRFIKLVIADTGIGMDAAIQQRIFEPFFTTKAPGEGSGLGLASVYGIVTHHGGIIEVASEVNKGTVFTIWLPATDQIPAKIGEPAPAARPGHGTILVVDDEEKLLTLTGRLLRAMGYEVLTAASGRDAIELVRQHQQRISLVILDLTMPDMSGAKTYEALRQIAPDIKVLVSSGFGLEEQAQELLNRGCQGFLQKPFDASKLSERIRAIL